MFIGTPQATKFDSSDVVVWTHLAELCIQLENFSLARVSLEKCLAIQPSHMNSWDCLVDVGFI
jgi:hypothetical protein